MLRDDEEKIRQLAANLDRAIEDRDVDKTVQFFAIDCEIETVGLTLRGHDGVRKWAHWLFAHLRTVAFEPRVILVQGNLFVEEFLVRGTTRDGIAVESKQCEVLEYEGDKIRSLRIYLDRLDFAESLAANWIQKAVVKRVVRLSTEGLSQAGTKGPDGLG